MDLYCMLRRNTAEENFQIQKSTQKEKLMTKKTSLEKSVKSKLNTKVQHNSGILGFR